MFPMYRGKRQSKGHKTENTLVLGPRRRRDVEPHDGNANGDNVQAIPVNEEPLLDDDSYEAPVVPSKASVAMKKAEEKHVIGDNKETNEKLNSKSMETKKIENNMVVEKDSSEKLLNPPAASNVQAQEYAASNENLQNPFCTNFILPLTRTKVDGLNYYNMSVSLCVLYYWSKWNLCL